MGVRAVENNRCPCGDGCNREEPGLADEVERGGGGVAGGDGHALFCGCHISVEGDGDIILAGGEGVCKGCVGLRMGVHPVEDDRCPCGDGCDREEPGLTDEVECDRCCIAGGDGHGLVGGRHIIFTCDRHQVLADREIEGRVRHAGGVHPVHIDKGVLWCRGDRHRAAIDEREGINAIGQDQRLIADTVEVGISTPRGDVLCGVAQPDIAATVRPADDVGRFNEVLFAQGHVQCSQGEQVLIVLKEAVCDDGM